MFLVAAGLTGLCCLSLSARAENLIPNGSFEETKSPGFLSQLSSQVRGIYAGAEDSPFQGWAFGGRWERGEYSIAVSDQAHSGTRSCQITCAKKGRGGIATSPIRLKAGTIVKVSAWVKAQDAIGGRVFLNFEGTPGDGWTSKDLRTGTYDWTQFTKRAVVPGGKNGGEQTIAVFLYSTCEGTIWVDDVAVEVVDVNAMAAASDEPAAAPKTARPISEPRSSIGYRVQVVPALEKIFREDNFREDAAAPHVEAAAARNEYESIQLVIEAPWRPVRVKDVLLSDLHGHDGARIPAGMLKWDRVDYVETNVQPLYFAERGLGWYPDPLMPAGPFIVEKLSRTPIWITLKTPSGCPPGEYTGEIRIVPEGLPPTTVPVKLTVWDFTLTDQTHLRTMTWLGQGVICSWYGNEWSPDGQRRQDETVRNYENFLLEHRLGPGGEIASHVNKGKDGTFDFRAVDARLERLIGKGMNAFIMGTAPNLQRQKQTEYSPEFVGQFTEMIRAYGDHLREQGWLDKAYVYVYDEAPRNAWPEVKKIDLAIHAAAPQLRILQCLNQPEGVKELTGFADVFDVYVAQYHKSGVAASQKRGAEVWLAVCCYPMDHPNFFIEYPLLDLRVTPWICWKYKAAGFEYWSPTAWGANWRETGEKWPAVPWKANTFGRYNGDGHLIYPGADRKPYSSIRLEALRDGFEDYEYLWTLDALVKEAQKANVTGAAVDEAQKVLSLDDVVNDTGAFAPQSEKYPAYRARVAAAILKLKKAPSGGTP